MMQFYFLSVLLNLLIGIALFFSNNEKIALVNDKIFQIVVGSLSIFVSLVKLLSPVNGVLFLGDLLPVLAGFAGGAALLVSYYSEKKAEKIDLPELVNKIFIENKSYIGIACMAIAVIHFIVPSVLFL